MDELYRNIDYNPSVSSSLHDNNSNSNSFLEDDHDHQNINMEDVIKAQIANHPLYPTLLSSYIECRKVGAPPETASLLQEIAKQNQAATHQIVGEDPELDHFMKSYCDALHKCKEELSKPFDEATNFLTTIGSQLTHLCNQTQLPFNQTEWEGDGGGGGDGAGGGKVEWGDEDLKEMLMRKYSGYVSSLRKELLKKRKKGKLPNHAISALFDWWNSHYRWPYPTEEEKNMLSETTGLEHKQINNWFINQRKRHWTPSDDMRFALMDGIVDVDVPPSTFN